ncbi:MerR HTH family regulatory protein [Dehalogenimonas formicexedens]|uniref:MerR HTH family regulatory protein n=1 Tax=Dehalogenimonas formicexedens TaxID=1839801 RepID=A0A1P8F6K6_9CHLR|nr:MerR family transcriptional regulator [Dehalogenimonas formicexedens]APV44109.1 MerR HTH family regulatory protein [Dehalogenimonas formicexedens]
MSLQLKGTTYYRTAEVCELAGISRTTLFRWLKNDLLGAAVARDRRGWRLFTEAEAELLKAEANRVDGASAGD